MSASFLAGLVREVPRIEPPRRCNRLTSSMCSWRTWSVVALDQVLEAVAEADDFDAVVDGLDGDGADDAVDARGRAAADDQGEFTCRRHAAFPSPSWSVRAVCVASGPIAMPPQ